MEAYINLTINMRFSEHLESLNCAPLRERSIDTSTASDRQVFATFVVANQSTLALCSTLAVSFASSAFILG